MGELMRICLTRDVKRVSRGGIDIHDTLNMLVDVILIYIDVKRESRCDIDALERRLNDVKRESRCDIDALERRLKDRRYHFAVIEWYDLVDIKRFFIYEFDAMLEGLGIKGGSFLFSHFRIPRKSLDKGLVSLISHQDVLSLLKYVPSYKEIEVYVEKHTMEVVSGKGKGVVIEEIMEDDEVNEASKTGYRGQSLLLNENDVQTGNMDSISKVDHPPWSSGSLSDSDISKHPPWSSESMNEKRNKRRSEEFRFRIQLFENDFAFGLELSQDPIDMTKVVKAEQEIISGLVGDLETWNDDDDLLQQVDPYDWQQDLYHRDDEAEENAELFAE
ncbi:hypothetical protein Tco_1049070, partial [Tanacetum coccineum]